MARCYVSDKTTQLGRSHTHKPGVAGGRWKKRAPKTQRTFKANLQSVTILVDGQTKRVKLATDVIKRIKKDVVEGRKPVVQLAYLPENVKRAAAAHKAAKVKSATSVE